MVLASNNKFKTDIVPDDRRFLIPDLTTDSITKSWGAEKLAKFLLKYPVNPTEYHPDFIKFGKYVLQYESKFGFDNISPYKGKTFYEVCWNSMADYQNFMVEYLIGNIGEDYILLKKVKTKFKTDSENSSKFLEHSNLRKFFENYLYDGVNRIAEIVRERSDKSGNYKVVSKIIPTKEFREAVRLDKLPGRHSIEDEIDEDIDEL